MTVDGSLFLFRFHFKAEIKPILRTSGHPIEKKTRFANRLNNKLAPMYDATSIIDASKLVYSFKSKLSSIHSNIYEK